MRNRTFNIQASKTGNRVQNKKKGTFNKCNESNDDLKG